MRPCLWACTAAVSLAAAQLHAAELLPAKLSIYLNPVFNGIDSAPTFTDSFETDVLIEGNGFSERFEGSLYDPAESETSSALDFDLSISGEVFPILSVSGLITDIGAPSSFLITATLPIPEINGPATYAIGGNLTTDGQAGLVSGYSRFFGFFVNGTSLSSYVDGPFGPGSVSFSDTGALDCGLIGGCVSIQNQFAAVGPGDSQTMTFSTSFDLDAGTSSVPLPASLPLVLAGLGCFAVLAQRRRA